MALYILQSWVRIQFWGIWENLWDYGCLWLVFLNVFLAWILQYRGYIGWNSFIRWISIWYISSGFDLELIVVYLIKWKIWGIMMFISLVKSHLLYYHVPLEFESLIFKIWSCIGQLKDWCLNLGVVELLDMIYRFVLCYSYEG